MALPSSDRMEAGSSIKSSATLKKLYKPNRCVSQKHLMAAEDVYLAASNEARNTLKICL